MRIRVVRYLESILGPSIMKKKTIWIRGILLASAIAGATTAAIRDVGPNKTFATIMEAYAAAAAGDTILVHPRDGNAAYEQVRVYATKSRIAIIGYPLGAGRVRLSGAGFVYSGVGSTPRAMFQFNPGTDDCLVQGFEIFGCHNGSNNAAAVRINQANRITIRDCEIHDNDMGLMSNGDVNAASGADQLVENCIIHGNGNTASPGYNHNLYMGGTSVVIRGCNVYGATTGHNIKSRAHLTIVEGCYIHDSPNRELDLVDDAVNTAAAGSHALISGCVIRKKDNTVGNRGTIHFGQDGGNRHNGTLYLLHCTILSPYVSAITTVSAAEAGVYYYNCVITDPSLSQSSGQTLVALSNGAVAANSGGSHVWVSRAFTPGAGVAISSLTTGAAGTYPAFVDPVSGDYRLAQSFGGIIDAGAAKGTFGLPQPLGQRTVLQFTPLPGTETRVFSNGPDLGAFEWNVVAAHNHNWTTSPKYCAPARMSGQSFLTLSGRTLSRGARSAPGVTVDIAGSIKTCGFDP